MRIKNKNLANSDLRVDDVVYHGNADGVFEMSSMHALSLLRTPGWKIVEEPPAPSTKAPKPVAPRVEVAAPKPPPPAPSSAAAPPPPPPPSKTPPPPAEPEPVGQKDPEEAPESEGDEEETEAPSEADALDAPAGEEAVASEDEEEEEAEGPDLEAITTKQGLFEVAKKYEVSLTPAQKKLSVDELRKLLDQEIYGED